MRTALAAGWRSLCVELERPSPVSVLVWVGVCVALGLRLPHQVDRLPLALAAAVLLVLLAYLAFARPTALWTASFALLAIVRFEPAPVDVAFALLILASLTSRRLRVTMPPTVALPLALLAVLTLLSSINAGDVGRAVRFEFITLYMLVFAVWLTAMLDDADAVRGALRAYVLAAAASSLLGLAALQLHFPGSSQLLFGGADRIQAFFKDPNVFAPFLVPPFVVVLEEVARPRLFGWSTRRLLALLLVIGSGLVFAFSRAAWLNVAVAAATLVVVYTWRRRGLPTAVKATSAIAACVVAGLALLSVTGSLSFFQERSHLQAYDQSRFATQTSAFERATVHAFGYGPGQTEATLDLSTHSLYARAAYEQGLLGLVLLVVVLAVTLALALALVFRDADVHGLGSAALLASWLGLLVNSFFVDTLHWRHLWILAAFIWFGYAAAATRRPQPPPPAAHDG